MPLPSRQHNQPLYRSALRHAFEAAWRDRRLWPLALFASLLLSAGSYDVLLRAVDLIVNQTSVVARGASSPGTWFLLQHLWKNGSDIVSISLGVQAFIALTVFAIALVVFSCVSQAGLVYALGATRRGSRPTLLEAIHVGASAFWPVAALNAIVLTTLWIVRFLAGFPLYLTLTHPTPENFALYLLSFCLFVAASFVVTMIFIFALNALVLQGAPVAEALIRGVAVFKKHWLIAIETSVLLLCVALCLIAGFIVVSFFLMIPFMASLVAAAAFGSGWLWSAIVAGGYLLFVCGFLIFVAFLTQFQYATWTFLYRAIGEGGAVPKLHRWMRSLFGITRVPER